MAYIEFSHLGVDYPYDEERFKSLVISKHRVIEIHKNRFLCNSCKSGFASKTNSTDIDIKCNKIVRLRYFWRLYERGNYIRNLF